MMRLWCQGEENKLQNGTTLVQYYLPTPLTSLPFRFILKATKPSCQNTNQIAAASDEMSVLMGDNDKDLLIHPCSSSHHRH
jgi:hypothetical protein